MSWTKPLFALSFLVVAANPVLAAGNEPKKSQAQAWEQVEASASVSGENGFTDLVFQSQVDNYARELAAGAPAADQAHANTSAPKPFVIDAEQAIASAADTLTHSLHNQGGLCGRLFCCPAPDLAAPGWTRLLAKKVAKQAGEIMFTMLTLL